MLRMVPHGLGGAGAWSVRMEGRLGNRKASAGAYIGLVAAYTSRLSIEAPEGLAVNKKC